MTGGAAPRKLHVVHVMVNLGVGGAEIALLRLASAARHEGHRHEVIALMPEGPLGEQFASAGIDVVALDMRRAPVASFLKLVKLLRARKPDVVQSWLFAADFIGGLAARIAGCRVILWSIHSVNVSGVSSRTTRVLRKLNATLSRWVPTRIVSVASAGRRSHIDIGYEESKFVVIPNGFDIDYLQAEPGSREKQRAALGIAADELVIGWVGRYNAAKDCDTFLRAAARLVQKAVRVRFLMVGRQIDPDNARLMEVAQSSGVTDHLILAGEQRDVRPFYAAMDVFCMSSLTEAFPLVLGEAMCMGLPCVATDVGDSALLLGEAGRIVPSRSPQALAEGLQAIVQMDSNQRHTIGSAARARAANEFSLASSCDRYQALYRQMIDERGGR